MSVLLEVVITALFSVLMTTEEVKTEVSESFDTQKIVAVVITENCKNLD